MEQALGIALRVSIMYLYALAVLRLAGQRDLGQLSVADAIAIFIVGDMFDDIFCAEIPLAKGLVGVSTIVLLQTLVSYAEYRSPTLGRLVADAATLMVRDGRYVEEGLRHERMRPEDVMSNLHLKQVEELGEVKEAYQEPADHLSVLRPDEQKPARKRDLPALQRALG